MYKFNKKQKVIIGIIISIVFVAIGIYVYWSDNNENTLDYDKILEYNSYHQESVKAEKNETSNEIAVHVSGAVNVEGVFFLNEGARIKDAIEKAGGVSEDADISQINLAYLLEDGMKIYIPSKSETAEENEQELDNTNKYVITSSGNKNDIISSENQNNKSTSSQKVNINTANQAQLETIPGVGSATAQKIISYRNENGKFSTIEDIKNVSGIGDSKFNKMKDLITVK